MMIYPDEIEHKKVYYQYCLKLNKLFRIYDSSSSLSSLVENILQR